MKKFWQICYNILFIPALYLLLIFYSIFKSKIRRGIRGRKRIFEELIVSSTSLDRTKKAIWFHSSSLGEFEQAKPIIEKLKKEKKYNIFVSFFSPSGFENSRKYPFADLITYIPFDSTSNAKRFLDYTLPDLAVFMRYDIWPNHVWALKTSGIPVLLVDATMRKKSARKLPVVKSFHKALFKDFNKILTISKADANNFMDFKYPMDKIEIVGDTRFDRVYERSIEAKKSNLINPDVLRGKKILVAGSTWEQDEEVIIPAFKKLAKFDENALLIIAPHEPTVLHLEKIEQEFSNDVSTIRFSHLNNYSDERVIIVDSVGILLTLYTYADAAFVGGSFKQNVHNVLEAAVYGIPVLFGPKIENSQEAKYLINKGGAMMVNGKKEAYRGFRSLFLDDELRKKRGEKSYEYVQENIGATDKIVDTINKIL